jgi:hypothetical protein
MGMFDTLTFIYDVTPEAWTSPLFLCPEGHRIRELQTKELECSMDTYVIAPDVEGKWTMHLTSRDAAPRYSFVSGRLVRTAVTECKKSDLTDSVFAYGNCDECLPVFFESLNVWSGGIGEREVFLEFCLRFEAGRLVTSERALGQTREELRQQMKRDGVGVLPDDDRVVMKHIEARRKK